MVAVLGVNEPFRTKKHLKYKQLIEIKARATVT